MTKDYDDEPLEMSWDQPSLVEGWREATIVKVTARDAAGDPLYSKKGDRMVRVDYKLEPSGRVSDYLMLDGEQAETCQLKLFALGFERGEPLSVSKLMGRRALILCKLGEWNGQKKLEVDTFSKDVRGGYKPAPVEMTAQRPEDDKTPF